MILTLFAAFMMGLMGAAHCLAMCGGISASLNLANQTASPAWQINLLYNVGRVTSYITAGLIVGLLGSTLHRIGLQYVLQLLAAVFIILVAAYIGRWFQGLGWLERVGQQLIWRLLKPLAGKLLPVKHRWQVLLYGALWGWLPCGLVYSALVWSAQSQSPWQGAAIMAAFALGTLPAMLAVGYFSFSLKQLLNNPWFRHGAAITLLGYGLVAIVLQLSR